MNIYSNALLSLIFLATSEYAVAAKDDFLCTQNENASTETTESTTGKMTVFGLELGKPFRIKECPKKAYKGYIENARYEYSSNEVCFERIMDYASCDAIVTGAATIKFPPSKSPDIIREYKIFAHIIDGNLESIGFETMGLKFKSSILDTLVKKYGEPTKTEEKELQNLMGAKFNATDAYWIDNDLSVVYESAFNTIDKGFVRINTQKSMQWKAEKKSTQADSNKIQL